MFPALPRSEPRGAASRRAAVSLAILGLLLCGGQAAAASPGADWPSINADAAQSNANPAETSLTAGNVLKLKVRWTAAIPDISYPVVAGGRVYVPVLAGKSVHARALDAATGKEAMTYSKGAVGGLLVANGNLYAAGHSLEVLDPTSGDKLGEVKGGSTISGATFTYPLADRKVILAGYATGSAKFPNSLYAIDPGSNRVLWHSPSLNAQGTIARGRVLTTTAAGSALYDESSGRQVLSQRALYGDWFGGDALAYTVASVSGKSATLYAFDSAGRKVWSRTVGPRITTGGWAHAALSQEVFVAMMKPHDGVEALDALTGEVLWSHTVQGVQRMAVADNLLFVVTSALAQPVRIFVYQADTGQPVGIISISGGYYAFPTQNELMIADGMLFLRAVGPSGPQLVALGK